MPIQLTGGLERSEFWRRERDAGNARMERSAYSDWSVTFRPLTDQDRERLGPTDSVTVEASADEKEVVVGVLPEKAFDGEEPGDVTFFVLETLKG